MLELVVDNTHLDDDLEGHRDYWEYCQAIGSVDDDDDDTTPAFIIDYGV